MRYIAACTHHCISLGASPWRLLQHFRVLVEVTIEVIRTRILLALLRIT